jgi:hypothetical protein
MSAFLIHLFEETRLGHLLLLFFEEMLRRPFPLKRLSENWQGTLKLRLLRLLPWP